MMRQSLSELYGLQGGLLQQYLVFWRRMALGDFGPSLSAFPTPVSVLIWRALPWTAGLLCFATLLAWVLGNLLGGLAGYYRDSRLLRLAGVLAMGFHPIPYYIVAFVLLIVFGYLWPVLPISGGCADEHAARLRPALHRQRAAARHPAGAVAGAGRHRRLVHGHALAGLQHRDRGLRHLRRTRRRRAGGASCAPTSCATRWCRRSPASPCRSARIFNGAIITEQVFGYPGIGTLAGRCRARRRLQPGAGRHHGLDHRGRRWRCC